MAHHGKIGRYLGGDRARPSGRRQPDYLHVQGECQGEEGQADEGLPKPEVREEIQEMELDEFWHFLKANKTSVDFGKPMMVTHGVVSPGWWLGEIMLLLANSGNASPGLNAPITQMMPPSSMT